jgi:hypothetical protein
VESREVHGTFLFALASIGNADLYPGRQSKIERIVLARFQAVNAGFYASYLTPISGNGTLVIQIGSAMIADALERRAIHRRPIGATHGYQRIMRIPLEHQIVMRTIDPRVMQNDISQTGHFFD